MPVLRIRLFGSFRLRYGDTIVKTMRSPREQSLLAYLVLHRDAPQPRRHLAFLFWPGSTEKQARTNLRYLLHQVRASLPDADRFVHADNQTLHWRSEAPCRIDVAEFERAIVRAEHAEAPASLQPALEQAVTLYQEELLPGCYDEWIIQERERLHQAFIAALDRLILLLDEQGDQSGAIRFAQRLLRHDPLHEATYRRLMRLYAAIGDRARAARTYHTCRTVLQRELEVAPSAATQAAYAHIHTAGDPSVSGDDSVTPVPFTATTNLPSPLTSFVGREQEVTEVGRLLTESRLVTLTGPGGCGKTRLARQVAAKYVEPTTPAEESPSLPFPHGVWWIELATLSEPASVPQTVASQLGLREHASQTATETISAYLRPKTFLLILDNCEHVIDACAHLTQTLLHACPKLHIVATSREALGITGEVTWSVPGLPFPTPAEVRTQGLSPVALTAAYEAVRLFVDRATTVLPTFELTRHNAAAVARICSRLDGMPLALELAAARVNVLSPAQIAARLDDRFILLTTGSRTALPRHQTLQATIDWSYDLLSEHERSFFRRLAVFAGSFTLEAAQEVTQHADDTIDLVARLVDKSLVEVVEPARGQAVRYMLLETIRHYALDKLVAAGEAESTRCRHLDFFVKMAEAAEPWLTAAGRETWLQRLDRDRDNLRSALEWSRKTSEAQDRERGRRLAGALIWFWYFRGYWKEGYRQLTESCAEYERRTPYVAKALYGAGMLAWALGECASAREWLQTSAAMWQELGNERERAYALTYLGLAIRDHGDPEPAQAYAAESVETFRALAAAGAGSDDDEWGLALALQHRGSIAIDVGEYETARSYNQESLTMFRALEDGWGEALPLGSLAHIALRRGEYALAHSLFEENLAKHRDLGDRWHIAHALNGLGEVARCQGDHEQAEAHYTASLAEHRTLGNVRGQAVVLHNLGHVARACSEPDRARRHFEQSLALFRELENEQGIAECLAGIAGLAGRGRPQDTEYAARLLGAVDTWLESAGASLAPPDRAACDRTLTIVRTTLDERTFADAWSDGQTLTLEEALDALQFV